MKITTTFVVFILIFSLINQFVISNVQAEQNEVVDQSTSSNFLFIKMLTKLIGRLAASLSPILRFVVLAFTANPPYIEIGYNETVIIELGMADPSTGEFEQLKKTPPFFSTHFVNFEVIEYPQGTSSNSWFIDFKPYTIVVEKDILLKTNVTISLTSPPIAGNAIQSGLLKFRIADTTAYGDLWFAPKGSAFDVPIMRFFWFLSATIIMGYAKYSGTVDVEYKEMSVLVKVKPYHALKFDTMPLVNLKPDQLATIPVTLENLGNYNDTYNFRIVSDNKDIKISNPSSITLAPGEQKDIYLGISVPQSAFDYGTLHSVNIEAYSIFDPNVTVDQKTIYFETRGIYVSEVGGIGILFLIVILVIFMAIYLHRRRLFYEKYCTKPDKPWEIPEEKTYLDELKKTDEEKYNENLKMMHDEYKSALLWYENYIDATILEIRANQRKKKLKEPIFKNI
jgi:hypothetical protein